MQAIEKAVRRATSASAVGEPTELQPLWDNYGRVLRVELEGAAMQSVVVKQVCPPAQHRKSRDAEVRRKLRSYENEAKFYHEFAPQLKSRCRIPAAYRCQQTAEGLLFILEDLDAGGFPERRSNLNEQELQLCLRWLAAFHATFLGISREGLWKVGSYWQLGAREAELARMTDLELKRAASKLHARLNQSRYKTLVHGDAKPANFCFAREGTAVAGLDFQYVGGGCGMKDVAYLLDCCLSAEELEHGTGPALEVYFQALRAALVQQNTELDVDALEKEWRSLYPVAWADFMRFLDGWAPGQYPPGDYSQSLIAQAIKS